MKIREAKDGNGLGDIWGTTVRNNDEELKTFWDLWFKEKSEYRMVHEEVVRPT